MINILSDGARRPEIQYFANQSKFSLVYNRTYNPQLYNLIGTYIIYKGYNISVAKFG